MLSVSGMGKSRGRDALKHLMPLGRGGSGGYEVSGHMCASVLEDESEKWLLRALYGSEFGLLLGYSDELLKA